MKGVLNAHNRRGCVALSNIQKKPRSCERGFPFKLTAKSQQRFLVHAFHAAAVAATRRSFLLFRQFGDQRFSGEHQGRD
jgi:hypothetical protein